MQAFDLLLGSNSVIFIKFWHLIGLKKREIQNLLVELVLQSYYGEKNDLYQPFFASIAFLNFFGKVCLKLITYALHMACK